MAITYDLSTNLGKVRLKIGDVVNADGVLPSGANVSDAEITEFLAEADDDISAAAALACDYIASVWASKPKRTAADGLSVDRGDVVGYWRLRAETLRGSGGTGVGSSAVNLVRSTTDNDSEYI